MTDRPDVVVVGAGLGGLACGAQLASIGARVTVLERHSLVGGYASSFSRPPFTFDVSQHSVGGLAPGQSFDSLLDRIGVAGRVQVAAPEHLATVITASGTLGLPNGPHAAVDALSAISPAEKPALVRLLDECESIHQDTVAGALESDMRRLIRGMRLAGNRTFAEALQSALESPALRNILCVPWVLIGLPPSRAAYSWFAKVLTTTFLEGTGHIVGGGQALADAMASRIREQDGTVITGMPATRIVTEAGVATGVETQAGDFIECRAVVASCDPWALASLVDDDLPLPEAGEPSLSMVALYLGLEHDPASLGIPDGATFICVSDAETAYRASLRGDLDAVDIVLSSPSAHDPGGAPEGKGMIHAVALVNGRPWFDLGAGAYQKRKRDATAALLGRLETHFPGLTDAVAVKETATPRTMHGYTRNHLGAVYGLAQTVGQSGARRPGATTPIKGLYRTGAWVLPGGGYSAATLSGLMTARDVGRYLDVAAPTAPRRITEREDTFRTRIYYEDTDTDGLTYHLSYLRFFDRARTEMFLRVARQKDIPLPRAVVMHIDARYHRPCTLGDRLAIHTRARFASDYRVVFEQQVHIEGDDAPLAEATTDMAFVDEAGNAIPCPVRDKLEAP